FIVNEIYSINTGIWTYNLNKNRKLFFRDPLIYLISMEWNNILEPDNGYFLESVVLEHLNRYYTEKTGYFRFKDNKEIDFYSKDFAIEVKSTANINEDDPTNLLRVNSSNKKLLYTGTKRMSRKDVDIVPLWDFLLEI
ncbi:MAG: DUF4143 domain-containing protein, partial [Oligoflexia bacterium]|nr:DUF4143 domain-containing protein [Oligoflexia bacterium]